MKKPRTPRKAAPPAHRSVTLPELARTLGVGERTLYRHREAGDIAPVVPGSGRRAALYDLLAVAKVLLARPEDARQERDRAQAALLRLRVAREERFLLPAAAVARDGRGVVQTATLRLLKLPSDLVRLGVVPAEREELVEAVVREALDELSRLETIGGEA